MSHIAHAELPKLSFLGNTSDESEYEVGSGKKHRVLLVVPVSAAMALSALHLQLHYGEKSDGLVTCRDVEILGSVGDIKSLEDLTYEKRKQFLSQHKLPKRISLISFCSKANVRPGVISLMSHIAHVELLKLSFLGNTSDESEYEVGPTEKHRVPLVVPISAAMALSAPHLQLRYGEKSDGLVTCHDGADASEMCEALLIMLVELGKVETLGVKSFV
uniref:Alpha/beta hydrolase fold protein n=1 Tax=Tanacetum cinerariifolium TaxID=118510 RepID=A0A6L2LN77_TANCI|nr:alpha/beta hydrolase fold protein [Tanacetum cinerariifolium]